MAVTTEQATLRGVSPMIRHTTAASLVFVLALFLALSKFYGARRR